MTEHLPECPIFKPWCDDEEFPEHGFRCNLLRGRCLHCMADCICDTIRACEARVIGEAVQRVEALQWDYTHSSGELIIRAKAINAMKESDD